MRVGLISDIHAQPEALSRAIAQIKPHRIDKIICAGDLVDKGPDDLGVIELIKAQQIPCVRGNHESAILRCARDWPEHPPLPKEALGFLDTLPEQLHYSWDGLKVVVAHGCPGHDDVYLWDDAPLPKVFKRWARSTQVDLVIVGHTHRPMCLSYQDIVILNPGSVSELKTRDSATYGVLDTQARTFDVFDLRQAKHLEGWDF